MAESSSSGGTPPDKTSITKNANGALQVERPYIKILGYFRNSFGSWSKSVGSGHSITTSQDGASYSMSSSGSGGASLTRDVDVTGHDKLKIHIPSAWTGGDHYALSFDVLIDGTQVFGQSGGDISSLAGTTTYIDLSSYSGTITISMEAGGGAYDFGVTVGEVAFVKNQRKVFDGAGN